VRLPPPEALPDSPAFRVASAPAISVRGVSKSFVLPHDPYSSVKERLLHPFKPHPDQAFHALHDVSFEVRRGEFFGVLGRNGSGKSTLMRCIAGIYGVNSGSISVEGRIASFIELGLGFHPELTARDNAITSAVMFGLSPREAAQRFDDMLAFAELEQFVDQKLKNYSSGMALRLGFAVAVEVDAAVLLFDEVLAVGDAAFRAKCSERFERLRDEGRTIVLVTHEMEMVRALCDRALLLHRGELVKIGDPETIATEYERLNSGHEPRFPAVRTVDRRMPVPPSPQGSLFGDDPRRFLALVRTLTASNYRLKYADTYLNYLWAVARPLAMFGVLLLVFTALGRFHNGIVHYPAYLLAAVTLWTFFLQTTTASVQCLVQNAEMLRKVPFPPLALPLSLVLTAVLDLCINLVIVLGVVFASGIRPELDWLEFPLLISLLAALASGLSLVLAALYVRYRDIEQVWLVVGQTIFFLTPIFYVTAAFPAPFDRVEVLANPLAALLTELRHAVIDPSAPSAAATAGGGQFLLVPVALCLAVLAIGVVVFRRESVRAAENV
jgi:ABC-type polysaccharide/polyol phosphate transport system ATPase subunit/ABC-type polysaccharide/polyol phosphate export permease